MFASRSHLVLMTRIHSSRFSKFDLVADPVWVYLCGLHEHLVVELAIMPSVQIDLADVVRVLVLGSGTQGLDLVFVQIIKEESCRTFQDYDVCYGHRPDDSWSLARHDVDVSKYVRCVRQLDRSQHFLIKHSPFSSISAAALGVHNWMLPNLLYLKHGVNSYLSLL